LINSVRAFLKSFEFNIGLIRVSSVSTVTTGFAGVDEGEGVGAVAGVAAGAGDGAGGSGLYAP
jgi:hypothetical protein